MSETFEIKNISINSNTLDIEWKDGKKSNFLFMWLRDNCPNDVHPTANQRTFDLLTVSEDIHPNEYKVNNKGQLEIKWSEGNHTSYFEPKWLKNNCYTLKSDKKYISPYFLWDSSLQNNLEKISLNYTDVINDESYLENWLEILNIYGFSIIKNSPIEQKSALQILNKISHIRETFFGTPFEVINIPNPNNTAYTAERLCNHTDLPYYEYAPGYQFLHCLVNDAEGGLSKVVDAFKVANFLRENEREMFETLTSVPVKFKDNDYTQTTIRIFHSPLITLNKDNDFNDIRFSIATMGAVDCHPKEMAKFYKAYRKFASLLHDEKYCVSFLTVILYQGSPPKILVSVPILSLMVDGPSIGSTK